MMDNEIFNSALHELQDGILHQGIIVKAILDVLIEKKIIDREEFDTRVESLNKQVNKEIESILKTLDPEGEVEIPKGHFFGQGGDA